MRFCRSLAALALAVPLLAAAPAIAQNSANNQNMANKEPPARSEDRPDPKEVEAGKQLYAVHCSHCHGFNMRSAGTVTYDLREFPLKQQDRFFESVTNGRNNRMPPWGDVLTQDEIGEIWAYVRTRGKS